MKTCKVIRIDDDSLIFDNGYSITSHHENECCESHYLWFDDLSLSDFDGLEFDLNDDDFLERIDGYGIALKPINGFPVRIPGYGYNNGWYSNELSLVITDNIGRKKYIDISDCQKITGDK